MDCISGPIVGLSAVTLAAVNSAFSIAVSVRRFEYRTTAIAG
jgi:hypothetical protein